MNQQQQRDEEDPARQTPDREAVESTGANERLKNWAEHLKGKGAQYAAAAQAMAEKGVVNTDPAKAQQFNEEIRQVGGE